MNKKDFIVQGSYFLLLFLFLDQNMEDEDGHTCDGIVMSQEDMEALDEGQLVDIGEERLSEIECEADEVVEIGEERQSETECEADEVVEISEERQSETECEADEVVEIGEERQSEIECEADEVWDEDDGLENADILNEIVRDVAGGQTDVEIEPTLSDISETKLAEEFVAKGCGCTFLKGEQCCQQFSTEYITEVRSRCLSLSRDELEMAILGQIMANSNSSSLIMEFQTRNGKGLTVDIHMVANRFVDVCFSFFTS